MPAAAAAVIALLLPNWGAYRTAQDSIFVQVWNPSALPGYMLPRPPEAAIAVFISPLPGARIPDEYRVTFIYETGGQRFTRTQTLIAGSEAGGFALFNVLPERPIGIEYEAITYHSERVP